MLNNDNNNYKRSEQQEEKRKREEPIHEYGLPETEPHMILNGEQYTGEEYTEEDYVDMNSSENVSYHDDLLSVFADEIFPNEDLGIY